MSYSWLDQVKKRLQAEVNQPGVVFDRLVARGLINAQGEPTGKLHRWDAYLAITEVKRISQSRQIETFRCLKPVFGLPGREMQDIPREVIKGCLKEGKKIVTARWDKRLSMWLEGCAIRLSDEGWIVCQTASEEAAEDNVGELPEFQPADSPD